MSKIAIVTGAARGIGLTTTKLFLPTDWRVVMVGRDEIELQKASAELPGTLPILFDVSMPPVSVCQHFGHQGSKYQVIRPYVPGKLTNHGRR